MRTIEESVVIAMDGKDKNLYSYLPYILQDLWEFGASPEIIINLIKKHKSDFESLKILDVGCGKGAVSIKIAKEFKCNCFGIDAVKEFVDELMIKAKEYNVEKYCTFEAGDVRTKLIDEIKYDIVLLGAIGPVFGDYYSTLTRIKNCLLSDGLIIVDDSYINETSNFSHSQIEKKSHIIHQITNAKMRIIDEVIISEEQIKESNKNIFNKIKTRCEELIKKEPKDSHLFEEYIKNQEIENEVLEHEVICSTMVIGNI
jgi:2-polyprenyl-3-methyl-5-hydroxy-6-metoxy-1,4-benzoquinol methylase